MNVIDVVTTNHEKLADAISSDETSVMEVE